MAFTPTRVHKTPHALLSPIKKEPTIHHIPPHPPSSISSATSMRDNDHYDPNESMVHIINDVVNKLPDFPAIPRDIQNQAKRCVGSGLTEARLFREFFGTSVRVIELLWKLIVQGNHLPDNGRPEHLMWCLHFLKVYPKQGPGYAAVSGSERGALDPRTHRKWVWKFIEAVAELVDIVARIFVYFCIVCCHRCRGDARRR
jgi:hypothetical protein